MENAVTIDYEKSPPLIKSSVTRTKPQHCRYPVAGLPWEVLTFQKFQVSRQQQNLIGAHLQLFEFNSNTKSFINFKINRPKNFLFFVLNGYVQFFDCDKKQISEAEGPCYYLTYNPVCELTLKLEPGHLACLAITLDQDWPITKLEQYPAFAPLIEIWKSKGNNFIVLDIKPISKEIEIILAKIRFLIINNIADYLAILKLIADCVYIYHGTLLPIEKKKELELQLKGIILKEYLQNNFLDKEKCNSKTIRKELGWSVWTLRMVTEEILRCTIPQHNMKLTMNFAKQEVAGSGRKIKEIALQLGFSGTESFGRRFKKETGLTPTLYREKYKKH